MGCYFIFIRGKEAARRPAGHRDDGADARRQTARVEGQMVPYRDGYQLYATAVEFDEMTTTNPLSTLLRS